MTMSTEPVADETRRLRAVVARLAQMADHWEQKLPEVIRTPAVVSAIRAALEPAAVSVVPPATNQTALREQVAEALVDWAYRSADRKYTALRRDETVRANAYSRADAVLAVLPAPVDRAAVLAEAAARYEEILANADTGQDPRYWTAVRDIALGLRAMADEDRPEGDDTVHACPGRWGGPACACFDVNEAEPAVGPRVAAEAPHTETRPQRGDAVEQWLKAQRDEYEVRSSPQWAALDEVLDTYRLHADMGAPLGEHVCEGRVVGDCECLEQPTAPAVVAQPGKEN
jgi:hypothetical protein